MALPRGAPHRSRRPVPRSGGDPRRRRSLREEGGRSAQAVSRDVRNNGILTLAAAGFFALAGPPAAGEERSRLALYDSDPGHLWNRLHAAVFIRKAPDGRQYGRDRLDPLLWPGTRHLLQGKSHEKAVELLNEFVRGKGERLVEDPLKRAVLQRDLWAVFDWLAGPQHSVAGEPIEEKKLREAQERLQDTLSDVIRRVALTPDEIANLPDNYAMAVRSGAFAGEHDAGDARKPFLPRELLDRDGPWICVGRPDGPVAPMHVRAGDGFTRSVFLVFLRLPGGRQETLEYLERLRAFDGDAWVEVEKGDPSGVELLPNPELPQLPAGTQVAFVRRMMLIDSEGRVRATGIAENVQLRVYRKVPEMTVRTFDAALVSGTAANRRARRWQDSYEFQLSRERLFTDRSGGLRAVGNDERDFHTGFSAHGYDEIETPVGDATKSVDDRRSPVLESCFACHSLPGVYSFNSHFPFRFENPKKSAGRRPAALWNTTPGESSRWYPLGKERHADWRLLRRLMKRQ